MKKFFKEPFFHFIIIGITLFFLYGLVNKDTDTKNKIILTDFDLENIISSFEMQWKRVPTEQELENIIIQNIKQEIFYQEALNMNLDHNDEIIKRRLSQKMQFLSNDIAALTEPTDAVLKTYYKENADKYLTPSTFSLYQITFSPDHRRDNYKDATETLNQFPNASFEEMKQWGDKLPFSYYYENVSGNELGLLLGSKFSEAIENQESNKWIGPIPSGFGHHLVFITNKVEPQQPKYEIVKEELIRNYEYDNQIETNELIYQELKKKYDIQFDVKTKDFDPKYIEYLEKELNN